jgi:hypothetical protein
LFGAAESERVGACNPEEIGPSVRLAFLLIALALVAACARTAPAREPAPYGPAARTCDDGGDGGVIIDGVCL